MRHAYACLQAYDELKNKRLSGGDNFMAHLMGPAGVITHASLEDKEDGTYLVTYCCTAAGMHDLHITIGKTAGVAPCPPTHPHFHPSRVKYEVGRPKLRSLFSHASWHSQISPQC